MAYQQNRLKGLTTEIGSDARVDLESFSALPDQIKELLRLGYGSLMVGKLGSSPEKHLVLKVADERFFLLDESGSPKREIKSEENLQIFSILRISESNGGNEDFLSRFKRAVNG